MLVNIFTLVIVISVYIHNYNKFYNTFNNTKVLNGLVLNLKVKYKIFINFLQLHL